MFYGYFNYSSSVASGHWDRHSFVRNWWRIYGGDARWTPPHYPTLYRALVRGQSSHLARLQPKLIHMQALQDSRRPAEKGLPRASGALWETPVGAAVLLLDPRRRDRTAYLGLLRCVNDAEALERLVYLCLEQAAHAGYHRLAGPTGLSPHLQSGVLQDHFHLTPPLHTAYNPPYVPDVMREVLAPLPPNRLYHVSTEDGRSGEAAPNGNGIQIRRVAKEDQQRVLVPLFPMVYDVAGEFPAPDHEEAAFLLDWVSAWPLSAWVAVHNGEPVAFVVLQPDLTRAVTWAGGGRNHLRRAWLTWRSKRPVTSGRLLFGGVLPEHRGKGIGDQLWRFAIAQSRAAGWQTLTVGPLPVSHGARSFLEARGAEPKQSYRLYTSET